MELGIYEVERRPWILKFDGFSTEKFVGVGIVIILLKGIKTTLSFNLAFKCTNNQAEYEVFIVTLQKYPIIFFYNFIIYSEYKSSQLGYFPGIVK